MGQISILPQRRLTAILVVLAMGCGGGEAGGGSVSDAGVPTLDACAILAGVDVAGFLGAAPDSLMEVLNMSDGTRAVTQCVASHPSATPTIGLMLRYGASDRNPTTRQEWIEREASADVMGMGEEATAALQAAEEVPGMGDLAIVYELIGTNLAVFWDGNRQMIVTTSDIEDAAVARQALEVIARRVLEEY